MEDLLQELRACAQMMQGFKSAASFKYNSNYDLVLDLGRPFEQRLEHDYLRPKKLCFQNCFDLVRQIEGSYHYCEGLARPPQTCGMLFDHAWLIDEQGRVLDPTWHGADYAGTAYYGIPLQLEYLLIRAVKTEVYGVLGHVDLLRDGLPPEALVELLVD
jgi:hypothetical protein